MTPRQATVMIALVSALGGCKPRSTAWVPVHSSDGKFVMSFPAIPTEVTKPVTVQGVSMEMHTYDVVRKDGREYGVVWSDYPDALMKSTNAQRIVDNIVAGFGRDKSKKVLSVKTLTVSGQPATEVEVDMLGGNIHRTRLFMVGNRLYQLMTFTPIATRGDSEITSFLDSFALSGH